MPQLTVTATVLLGVTVVGSVFLVPSGHSKAPYAGDLRRNTVYAATCLRDSLTCGEAPFASHLLYLQALLDDRPGETTCEPIPIIGELDLLCFKRIPKLPQGGQRGLLGESSFAHLASGHLSQL